MPASESDIYVFPEFFFQAAGYYRSAGSAAASKRFTRAAFINTQTDMSGVNDLHESDIDALGEQRLLLRLGPQGRGTSVRAEIDGRPAAAATEGEFVVITLPAVPEGGCCRFGLYLKEGGS